MIILQKTNVAHAFILNIAKYAVKAMTWEVGEGLITGIASNGQTKLAPKNTAIRAQIAAIIMRYLEKVSGK